MKIESRYILRIVSGIPLLICATVPVDDCWVFELNEMGMLIWQQCNQYSDFDMVLSAIEEGLESNLSLDQRNIILEYCNVLIEKGVINGRVWM